MSKARAILGIIAGFSLILSSAAHSFLGWKQLRTQLEQVQAPSDLILGVAIGWHFGGIAMLAFGCIMISLFVNRLKRKNPSPFPALVVAVAYLGFGTWALVVSKLNPFFMVFIVPGVLLAIAALPSTAERHSR